MLQHITGRGISNMSKKKRYDQSLKYNRQTKGHMQNIARGKMNALGVRSPNKTNINRVVKISRILFIVWIPIAVICGFKFGFPGLLAAMFVALLYILVISQYVKHYQQKLVSAYLEMGISKDVYMAEMRKRQQDAKSLAKLSKVWDVCEKKYTKKMDKKHNNP